MDQPSPFGVTTGDPQGAAAQIRALALRRASDWQTSTAPNALGIYHPFNTVSLDPKWEALKQALSDQGVDRLATSAAMTTGRKQLAQTGTTAQGMALGDDPGFFDTQDPRALQKQQLLQQLRAGDTNRGLR